MYTELLYLISTSETVNNAGDIVVTKSEREVYAELLSIGQNEFYQAQAVGLKPELKFRIADYMDYQGEKSVKYNNKEYEILRTYKDGMRLEITLRGGVNANT